MIDCPGVIVDTTGDTEEDSVLKGVVRAERLENPEDFIIPILKVVKREHIAAQYGLPKDGDGTWKDHIDLLEKIARKAGRLLKGGDPCLRSAAIYMIIDYQRGRLPHFVPPPELKEDAEAETAAPSVSTATLPGIKGVKQNLEEIVQRKEISDKKASHKDSEDEISDNEEGDNSSGGLIVTSGDWEDNK